MLLLTPLELVIGGDVGGESTWSDCNSWSIDVCDPIFTLDGPASRGLVMLSTPTGVNLDSPSIFSFCLYPLSVFSTCLWPFSVFSSNLFPLSDFSSCLCSGNLLALSVFSSCLCGPLSTSLCVLSAFSIGGGLDGSVDLLSTQIGLMNTCYKISYKSYTSFLLLHESGSFDISFLL